MTSSTNLIFLYSINDYKIINHSNETCEEVCKIICKEIAITPATHLLFGLRISGSNTWLPGCRKLNSGIKYDFRLRFKVPVLSTFKRLDKIAYNYYFFQVKNDVLNNKIQEIEYSKYKNKILGLCVSDMYREMLENKSPIQTIIREYKKYVPKKVIKDHPIFAQRKLESCLQNITQKPNDPYYVITAYLEEINTLAPNYLAEEYFGKASYLKEDDLKKGVCPVTIQFSPFHVKESGLRIFYGYKNLWKHIGKIDDIYAIMIENEHIVKIEMKDQPYGFTLDLGNKQDAESFVSCLSGYYRLMVKWNIDLCHNLSSPNLKLLQNAKIHGPIGGEFSYSKMDKNNNVPGSYIVRQCGLDFDTYFLDIIVKKNQPETFKITIKNNKWQLHNHNNEEESIQIFDNISNLARSVYTESTQKYRLAPSEYDKPPLLLICLPPSLLKVKKTVSELVGMRQLPAQIIDAANDLQLYKNTQKDCDGGIITQMRGEWKLPDDKKLEVTVKMLKQDKMDYLKDFMILVDTWKKHDSSEIIKLYGITLYQPIAMIMESTKLGPLNEFLRKTKQPSEICLIDAAYSLARALHYLHENNVVHSKIRCSSLYVVRYEPRDHLVVRLGDPGFPNIYTKADLPWIPVEYYTHFNKVKIDIKADIWAFATTLWEIFTRGKTPPLLYMTKHHKLPKPKECHNTIYDIMLDGWSLEAHNRFSPQLIFPKLIFVRETFIHSYQTISPIELSVNGSHRSMESYDTEQTDVRNGDSSYGSTDSEHTSNRSTSSTLSDNSILSHELAPIVSSSSSLTMLGNSSHVPLSEYDLRNTIIEFSTKTKNYKLIFKGGIGKGHYGLVYRGQLEEVDENIVTEVAIKKLKVELLTQNQAADFQRESKIMKKLKHPNIVKILEYVDDPEFLIIMEFVKHCSFATYIASNPSLTPTILLKFAKDIASGMEYLCSQNIVHRDLAARNILVDSEECVKISDFGLAQMTGPSGYYVLEHMRYLPIKWYAPETLHSNKYSHKSDVWSFGVTLHEMFSFGKVPNLCDKELTQLELLEALNSGARLSRPQRCPIDIYDKLMMPCWNILPELRPTFLNLLVIINELLEKYSECV